MISILTTLFSRDLTKLKTEISLYSREENLWIVDQQITNTAGNLCLHLLGNLNHYIGTQLGATGYVRNRPLEFSTKHIPRKDLLDQIDYTRQMIETTLQKLDVSKLDETYPEIVFGEPMTTGYFLIHLTTHLAYHLGQINYHRRLLDIT